ncbi:MAG: hypothetical protein GY874_18845 [Desulfobacteraceae bacterium]|nr:hypothetical protein [Desulfobacteraceae bacterium]
MQLLFYAPALSEAGKRLMKMLNKLDGIGLVLRVNKLKDLNSHLRVPAGRICLCVFMPADIQEFTYIKGLRHLFFDRHLIMVLPHTHQNIVSASCSLTPYFTGYAHTDMTDVIEAVKNVIVNKK